MGNAIHQGRCDRQGEGGSSYIALEGAYHNLLFAQALEHVVYYIVLASHDNEQSDMLHRIFKFPELAQLELH